VQHCPATMKWVQKLVDMVAEKTGIEVWGLKFEVWGLLRRFNWNNYKLNFRGWEKEHWLSWWLWLVMIFFWPAWFIIIITKRR
jgi:hypothetical protein